jgi:hypothetical protein
MKRKGSINNLGILRARGFIWILNFEFVARPHQENKMEHCHNWNGENQRQPEQISDL